MAPPKQSKPFILGRKAMEVFMAVDGKFLSEKSRRFLDELERKGLSHEEQRQAILDRHGVPEKNRKRAKKAKNPG